MTVRVRAGSWASRWLTDTQISGDTLTAREAAKLAGLPEDKIGLLVLHGTVVPPDTVLQDGDELWCHPFIVGG